MGDNHTVDLETRLSRDLAELRTHTQRTMMISGVLCLLIGGYLFWASHQLNQLLDPEGLALATTGLAVDAVPEASAALRASVVDGAPELAATASRTIIDAIPAYRQSMQDELRPVVDEVAGVLASAAVGRLVANADNPNTAYVQQDALQAGADAVVDRVDAMLDQSLDERPEDGGPTPRESIEASLQKLTTIDSGLRNIVKGQGDPRERELLLAWMNLIAQQDEAANQAAAEAWRAGERPQ